MSYATDGKCHNAQPGTFNHECGKPAVWIGTSATGWRSGFCDRCRRLGWEALDMVTWERLPEPVLFVAGSVDANGVTLKSVASVSL